MYDVFDTIIGLQNVEAIIDILFYSIHRTFYEKKRIIAPNKSAK